MKAAIPIRDSCVAEVKARVNLGEVAGAVVTLKARGADNLIGLCPFHSERTPSFHVHPERGFFKCFGCGKGGDVIDFVREIENLRFTEAVEALGSRFNVPIEYEDGTASTASGAGGVISRPAPRPIETRAPSQTWLRLQQQMRPGTVTELAALAQLRRLPTWAGLQLATTAGQLWFAQVFDDGFEWSAWIVTDSARRNAQARRTDGEPWSGVKAKAKTIAGCEASWPVGIADVGECDVALVEGGPDFLAAWHYIWTEDRVDEMAPVAMLGASQPIHPEALPLFAGRSVTIFPHVDDNQAGERGAKAWAAQLAGVAPVEFIDLRDGGAKDLNELVVVEPEVDDA